MNKQNISNIEKTEKLIAINSENGKGESKGEWDNLSFEAYKAKLAEINPVAAVEVPTYNLRGAWDAGIIPTKEGHMASRNPYTGEILKRPDHPSFDEAIKTELALGYKVYAHDGIFYSVSPQEVDRVFNTPKDEDPVLIGAPTDPVDIYSQEYMYEVANYIKENTFSENAYVKDRFENPKTKIEFVKRTLPDLYKKELYKEAKYLRDIELVPVYKKAMLNQYESNSEDESIANDFESRFGYSIEEFRENKEEYLEKDYALIEEKLHPVN